MEDIRKEAPCIQGATRDFHLAACRLADGGGRGPGIDALVRREVALAAAAGCVERSGLLDAYEAADEAARAGMDAVMECLCGKTLGQAIVKHYLSVGTRACDLRLADVIAAVKDRPVLDALAPEVGPGTLIEELEYWAIGSMAGEGRSVYDIGDVEQAADFLSGVLGRYKSLAGAVDKSLVVVDLCCGAGLQAPFFAGHAGYVGVDGEGAVRTDFLERYQGRRSVAGGGRPMQCYKGQAREFILDEVCGEWLAGGCMALCVDCGDEALEDMVRTLFSNHIILNGEESEVAVGGKLVAGGLGVPAALARLRSQGGSVGARGGAGEEQVELER